MHLFPKDFDNDWNDIAGLCNYEDTEYGSYKSRKEEYRSREIEKKTEKVQRRIFREGIDFSGIILLSFISSITHIYAVKAASSRLAVTSLTNSLLIITIAT